MTDKAKPETTTGGALNVREVQSGNLTEKELKTEDRAKKPQDGNGKSE
jgi:hypothetical protein